MQQCCAPTQQEQVSVLECYTLSYPKNFAAVMRYALELVYTLLSLRSVKVALNLTGILFWSLTKASFRLMGNIAHVCTWVMAAHNARPTMNPSHQACLRNNANSTISTNFYGYQQEHACYSQMVEWFKALVHPVVKHT